MNLIIQETIQLIGNNVLDQIGVEATKILTYAEVEEGVVSVAIFFTSNDFKQPIFKYAGMKLSELFYSLWSEWGKEIGESWSAISYTVTNGNINLNVIYQDKFDDEVDELVRRSFAVEEYFGAVTVDYSQP